MKKTASFRLCKLVIVVSFVLRGFALADNIYLKSGEKILGAAVTEVTPTEVKYKMGQRNTVYTVLKSDIHMIVYDDGAEDVFSGASPRTQPKQVINQLEEQEETRTEGEAANDTLIKRAHYISIGYMSGFEATRVFGERTKYYNSNAVFRYGPGYGVILGSGFFLPAFFSAHLGLQKGDYEYFWNNRLGVALGWSWDGDFAAGFLYEPSIGIQFNNIVRGAFNNINFSLGYNLSTEENLNSLAIRVGHRFEREKHHRRNDGGSYAKQESSPEKPERKRTRYFRPGIEINYPVYRSEIEFFNNEFPYTTGERRLVFQIRP